MLAVRRLADMAPPRVMRVVREVSGCGRHHRLVRPKQSVTDPGHRCLQFAAPISRRSVLSSRFLATTRRVRTRQRTLLLPSKLPSDIYMIDPLSMTGSLLNVILRRIHHT